MAAVNLVIRVFESSSGLIVVISVDGNVLGDTRNDDIFSFLFSY